MTAENEQGNMVCVNVDSDSLGEVVTDQDFCYEWGSVDEQL